METQEENRGNCAQRRTRAQRRGMEKREIVSQGEAQNCATGDMYRVHVYPSARVHVCSDLPPARKRGRFIRA